MAEPDRVENDTPAKPIRNDDVFVLGAVPLVPKGPPRLELASRLGTPLTLPGAQPKTLDQILSSPGGAGVIEDDPTTTIPVVKPKQTLIKRGQGRDLDERTDEQKYEDGLRSRNEKRSSRTRAGEKMMSILRSRLGNLAYILDKPTVSDIWRNGDGRLFVNEVGEGVYQVAGIDISQSDAEQIIAAVATFANIEVNDVDAIITTVLPTDGSRFTACRQPVNNNGASFAIRKHAIVKRTLADYVTTGALSLQFEGMIRKALRERHNLLIAGGTGSGKTTLANALLYEMAVLSKDDPSDRFLIIEDTHELQCNAMNRDEWTTTPTKSIHDLLKHAMRYSPKRIIIGEIRDGHTALGTLMAWNTGHDGGLATIHAGSCVKAMARLETLCKQSGIYMARPEIADAVNTVISIVADKYGSRKITEVKRLLRADDERWVWSGDAPRT